MLKTLLTQINSGNCINKIAFDSIDLDTILDCRDLPPFDSNWVKCYNEIENELVKNPLSNEDLSTIDIIREKAFKAVSSLTSQHEIASYISDDFDLIAKSMALSSNNAFATVLYKSYCDGKIPQ